MTTIRVSHTLWRHVRLFVAYMTLSTSFDRRSSLTSSCPPHPSEASREQDERRRRSPLLFSHALTTAQLSSQPNASPYYPPPGGTPAATLTACLASRGNPCEHTAHSVQPPACSRAPVRRDSCAPGRRVGRFRRNVYILRREKERESDVRLRDAMRGGGAARDPTRSKQLCRRGGRAATERDDGRCWLLLLLSLLVLLLLLLLTLLPLALASIAEATLLVGGGSIKAREKSWMDEGLGKKREMCRYPLLRDVLLLLLSFRQSSRFSNSERILPLSFFSVSLSCLNPYGLNNLTSVR